MDAPVYSAVRLPVNCGGQNRWRGRGHDLHVRRGLAGLVGGSFVIEYIFSWPGLGQLGVSAVFARDYPVIMGTLLMSSLLIIVGNLLADMCYKWVDPRVK